MEHKKVNVTYLAYFIMEGPLFFTEFALVFCPRIFFELSVNLKLGQDRPRVLVKSFYPFL